MDPLPVAVRPTRVHHPPLAPPRLASVEPEVVGERLRDQFLRRPAAFRPVAPAPRRVGSADVSVSLEVGRGGATSRGRTRRRVNITRDTAGEPPDGSL